MKEAILVTGLVTRRVRMGEFAHYHYLSNFPPLIATDGVVLEPMKEVTVEERIVPITQFCYGNGRPDLYVAYSHEIEELLGIPFQVILKEKETALGEAKRLRSMSAWEHIKAAYKLICAALAAHRKGRRK